MRSAAGSRELEKGLSETPFEWISSGIEAKQVGNFATFRCRSGDELIPLMEAARRGIQDVLERKLEDVKWDPTTSKETFTSSFHGFKWI